MMYATIGVTVIAYVMRTFLGRGLCYCFLCYSFLLTHSEWKHITYVRACMRACMRASMCIGMRSMHVVRFNSGMVPSTYDLRNDRGKGDSLRCAYFCFYFFWGVYAIAYRT